MKLPGAIRTVKSRFVLGSPVRPSSAPVSRLGHLRGRSGDCSGLFSSAWTARHGRSDRSRLGGGTADGLQMTRWINTMSALP